MSGTGVLTLNLDLVLGTQCLAIGILSVRLRLSDNAGSGKICVWKYFSTTGSPTPIERLYRSPACLTSSSDGPGESRSWRTESIRLPMYSGIGSQGWRM